jgi:hypothetical protein
VADQFLNDKIHKDRVNHNGKGRQTINRGPLNHEPGYLSKIYLDFFKKIDYGSPLANIKVVFIGVLVSIQGMIHLSKVAT